MMHLKQMEDEPGFRQDTKEPIVTVQPFVHHDLPMSEGLPPDELALNVD